MESDGIRWFWSLGPAGLGPTRLRRPLRLLPLLLGPLLTPSIVGVHEVGVGVHGRGVPLFGRAVPRTARHGGGPVSHTITCDALQN